MHNEKASKSETYMYIQENKNECIIITYVNKRIKVFKKKVR